MRVVVWCARLLVFLALLGFALSNTEPVRLRFLGIPQIEGQAPLVLWLLIFFSCGAFLGAVAMLPTVLGQRRDLTRLRHRDAARVGRTDASVVPVGDASPAMRDPGLRTF